MSSHNDPPPHESASGEVPPGSGQGKPALVLIVGPTAAGKTEFAIEIARQLNGEIVSADSRLFYRGMNIGTAKPTLEQRRAVAHHLIDVADPDDTWSLAMFQSAARSAIDDIHARAALPLLVGGTGQYVRAVSEGWSPPAVRPDRRLRLALEKMAAENGAPWIHERLRIIDAEAAGRIDARNVRRTIRALEVIFTTGHRFSAQYTRAESPYCLSIVGLIRPRAELYARIDERIDAMFAAGFEDEVRGLLERGCSPDLPSFSAIGYRECAAVLEGRMTRAEAVAQIKRLTRIFVRRQANWFKPSDPHIKWFEVGPGTAGDIVAHLLTELARNSRRIVRAQADK